MKYISFLGLLLILANYAFSQRNGSPDQLLLKACKEKNHKQMVALLANGANVNYIGTSKEEHPLAPILVSSLVNDSVGIGILLKHGADISIMDNMPLAGACMFGCSASIQKLLDNGVGFEGEAKEGLHFLARKAPPFMKLLFIGSLMTDAEIEAVPFPESDEDGNFKISLEDNDRPFLEAMDMLIGKGFPNHLLNDEGYTALDVAIEIKHIPFINKLINLHVRAAKFPYFSEDLISIAAFQGNLDILKDGLAKHPEMLNQPNSSGSYPIIEAFKGKNESTIDELLNMKAALEVTDSAGNNILHYASEWKNNKYWETLKPLVKVLSNKKNILGRSPFYLAALNGNKQLFQEMSSAENLMDTIFRTLVVDMFNLVRNKADKEFDADQITILKSLMQKSIYISAIKGEQTAIRHIVIELPSTGNNREVVKLLTDYQYRGPELNDLISNFVNQYEDDFLQALVYKGLDKSILMDYCIVDNRAILVDFLLSNETNDADRSRVYANALFSAVGCQNENMVQLLLSRGIDPNQKGRYGNVPLDMAIGNNDFRSARLLLEGGARLDETILSKEVLVQLQHSNQSGMQKLFGLLMLKNQLIIDGREGDKSICSNISIAGKEILTFKKNMDFRLPGQNIHLDQVPRFWEWYPWLGVKSGSKASRLGYASFDQRELGRFELEKENTGEKREEYITVQVSDPGYLPRFDFGQLGESEARKLRMNLHGQLNIPPVEYDKGKPLSYPSIMISNNSFYSTQPITILQKDMVPRILLPGDQATFDRSSGALSIKYDVLTEKAIELAYTVEYNIGPKAEIVTDSTLIGRLLTYAKLNNARRSINSGQLSSHELKSQKTYQYVLSQMAIAKGYEKIIYSEIQSTIKEINAINSKIASLYALLYNERLLQVKDSLVANLEQIIKDGKLDRADMDEFHNVSKKISISKTEIEIENIVAQFLKNQIFKSTEDKIFSLQLLMLEAAQYLCTDKLDEQIEFVSTSLQNKQFIPSSKLIVSKSDLSGRGQKIIQALTN